MKDDMLFKTFGGDRPSFVWVLTGSTRLWRKLQVCAKLGFRLKEGERCGLITYGFRCSQRKLASNKAALCCALRSCPSSCLEE
jgi:hypothetical protein